MFAIGDLLLYKYIKNYISTTVVITEIITLAILKNDELNIELRLKKEKNGPKARMHVLKNITVDILEQKIKRFTGLR